MYDGTLEPPIQHNQITVNDEAVYNRAFSGADLVILLLDGAANLIARGVGVSWSDNNQQQPVMELGHRAATEIVTGAMNPGQLQVQTVYFLKLNDYIGNHSNLILDKEYTAIVGLGDENDPDLLGKLEVLDVYIGVKINANSGNLAAGQNYMRTVSMIYRKRLTGIQYKVANAASKYPATSN